MSVIAMCVPGFSSAQANSRSIPQAPAPFHIGERLKYRVDWGKYSGAAEVNLQVVERGTFYGSNAWHLRATIQTLEPLRALHPLDARFDSFDRLEGFAAFRYLERVREFGKLQESDLQLISPGSASSGGSTRAIIPPGTRDPVSAIYFLRQVDWRRNSEVRFPLYDGEDLHDAVARRVDPEEIRLTAGNFNTMRIAIRLLQNGQEGMNEPFTIWLTRDSAQTPVAFEARLANGTLRAGLVSALEEGKISGHEAPFSRRERSNHLGEN